MTVEAARTPRLTFLVAAWNEESNVEPFIESYLALDYPNRELVLCAGGTDATYERAMRHAGDNIKVIRQYPGDGKQRALRRGFEHAAGDIIVLTDADCLLDQTNLSRLIKPIVDGESEAATGVSTPRKSQLAHPFVYYQYAVERKWGPVFAQREHLAALLGRNCAVSRAALEDVGAFDEDVPIGTDSFLAKKLAAAGYSIRRVPESAIETEYPATLRGYLRQRSRWRRNAILHNVRFRQYRRVLKALVAPTRSAALLVMPLLGVRLGRPVIGAWLVIFAYSVAGRLRIVHSAERLGGVRPPPRLYRYLPAYVLTEWAAQTVALTQLLSARARRKW